MLTRRYRDDQHRPPVVARCRLHASRRLVLMLTTPDDCYMSTADYRLPTRTAAPLRATGDALLGSKPSNRTNRTVCKRGCIKLHSHDTQTHVSAYHSSRFPRLLETPGIVLVKFPRPGNSWKMSLVLECPGNLSTRSWKVVEFARQCADADAKNILQ